MKKIICAIALLTAALSVSAQDGVVRKARYKLEEAQNLAANKERTEKEDAKLKELISTTLEQIEPTLTSPETKKQKANAWDIKANLELFQINPIIDNLQKDQAIDTIEFARLVSAALDAIEHCYQEEVASGILEKYKKDNTVTVYSMKNKLYAMNCRQYLAFCGQMFFTNHQYDKAVEAFKKYMHFGELYTIVAEETKLNPDDENTARMAYFTCLAAYFAKDYKTLGEYISLAKKYTEERGQVDQLELTALIEQGDTTAWLEAGKRIVIEDPQTNEGIAQNMLAYYFSHNDTKGAAEFTEALLGADPNSKIGNYAKGLTLMNDKKYAEAIPFFETATEADPDFSDAFYNAGVCYSNIGYDINEALTGKKMTAAQQKAEIQKVKDEYAKAEPFFLRVKELEPDNVHKWASRLSTVYYILGDKAKQAEMDKLLGE
ncbi:MAG: hypothetical protein K6C30_04435 [Bacteroidaceae bacterium]|nr:hypothetical protein [Bacteroidaceae bacterium]